MHKNTILQRKCHAPLSTVHVGIEAYINSVQVRIDIAGSLLEQ